LNDGADAPVNSKTVARSTSVISFFSFLGLAFAFLLQVLLAAKFGARMEMDAYLAASTIPQLVMMVFLGSLHVTFVPVFVESETKQSAKEAWEAVSVLMNLMFVVLAVIATIGFFGARRIVSLVNPGFEGEVFELTVKLLKVLLPAIVFSGMSVLLSSVHYARREFARPSFAPVLSYLLIIGFVLALQARIGVISVAVGYLAGGIAQFVLLVPILLRERRYSFSFSPTNNVVMKIVKLMLPLLLATGFTKANTLIDRLIASGFPEGSISYLGYSYRITTALVMLATRGVSLSLFPIMSRLAAEERLAEFRDTASKGIRMILLVILPIAMVILILREPIIEILLERGKFGHKDTVATGLACVFYLGAFLSLSIGNVVTFAFYAFQDTLTVVKVGVLGACLNVALALILGRLVGYSGLALAFSIVASVNLFSLVYLLRRKAIWICGKSEILAFLKMAAASSGTGIVLYFTHRFVSGYRLPEGVDLAIDLAVALGSYTVACLCVKSEEMSLVLSKVRGKLASLWAGGGA